MTNRIQSTRLKLFQWALVCAFVSLAGWLVYLQGICHQELKKDAEANTHRRISLEPRRGDILDIKKNLLATSIFVKTICADPQLVAGHETQVAKAIAPLLQMSAEEVEQRLRMRFRRAANGTILTNHYVPLKHKVPSETWQRIQQTMSGLTFGVDEKKLPKTQQAFFRDLRRGGVYAEAVDDQLRVYPNQTLAAHVLGYVGTATQTSGNTEISTTIGTDGIERTFNKSLCGQRGWRVTETDLSRRELVDLRTQDVAAHDGLNVVLSLDSVVQHFVEEALGEVIAKYTPASACAIVVRPRTGEILALANLPTFDPNHLEHTTPDDRRDRLVCDTHEPGSTFKIVVVSAALNDGIVRMEDRFDCENGKFIYAGKPLHDAGHSYGVLSVEEIITKSSNIGAAKIGITLGEQRLYRYMTEFGFHSRTDVPLPAEAVGTVHPLKEWSRLSITRIPMGHEVAVTPLQMTMAMCAIANRGRLMRPMLVDRLEDPAGKIITRYEPQPVRQVITEATAKLMVQALKSVVSVEGTAPLAALEHYTVAGKTGTAQKAVPGGYSTTKYFSSFIGFFPADAPELCVGIFLDEPKGVHYGGQTAAPVFKQIASRSANYLNIKPDLEPDSTSSGSVITEHSRGARGAGASSPRPVYD